MLYKTTTKLFPTSRTIGIHLLLEDDDRPDLGTGKQMAIDRDFYEFYTKGSGMTKEVESSIGKKAQAAIDAYIERKKLYISTSVTQIHDALKTQE